MGKAIMYFIAFLIQCKLLLKSNILKGIYIFMKSVKLFVAVMCLLVYGTVLSALNVGDDAPPITVLKWVKGDPVTLFPKKEINKKIYVVFFWATWSHASPNLMQFMTRENSFFGRGGVEFVGISKERSSRIRKFVKKYPDINFSMGIDKDATTYDAYMQGTNGVPMIFLIGRNEELVWKGTPFEFERVLIRVLSDSFDIEIQNKIEKIRKKYSAAANMMDKEEELKYAKDILKLDPTDRSAINVVVDNFINDDKVNEAVDFIISSREKTVANKYAQRGLFFLELGILRGMNNYAGKEYLSELVTNYYDSFTNDAEALNSLVINVLRNMPLEIIPLSEILKTSRKSVELVKNIPNKSTQYGAYLQSLARTYYYAGCLDLAISTQAEAIGFIKEDEKKKIAELVDSFYNNALELYENNVNK